MDPLSRVNTKRRLLELDEQEKLLKDTTLALGEEQKITEAKFTRSMAAIDEATRASVDNQIITFADLSETQAATVENMKATWGKTTKRPLRTCLMY